MTTTIEQVFQAIITLAEGDDVITAMEANNTLDSYRWENPNDVISDMIDIFFQAVQEQNHRTVNRIIEYSKNCLEDL